MTHKRKVALVVFGTRPEAIKMAPLVLELKRRADQFLTVVAVTAQHREMLDQVNQLFGIEPDHDLDIMRHGQTLADITMRAMTGLDWIISTDKPDVCIVQGDTTTTFVAGLASFYHKVPVAHVEAGLRTDDRHQPFPEEINRRLTSVLADWHFAPTQVAADRLLAEDVPASRVFVTGNTVIDALLEAARLEYTFPPGPVADALASGRRIVLVTLHRRENWGEPVVAVCRAIKRLAAAFPDVHVLFSVHRNPVVRDVVNEWLSATERITLMEPVDYLPFVKIQQAATLILSDSGGIQEEAPSLGTPVLVLRNTTERPEAVSAGTVRLVGTDTDRIVEEASQLLTDPGAYERMSTASNPFGDGTASRQIVDILSRELGA